MVPQRTYLYLCYFLSNKNRTKERHLNQIRRPKHRRTFYHHGVEHHINSDACRPSIIF